MFKNCSFVCLCLLNTSPKEPVTFHHVTFPLRPAGQGQERDNGYSPKCHVWHHNSKNPICLLSSVFMQICWAIPVFQKSIATSALMPVDSPFLRFWPFNALFCGWTVPPETQRSYQSCSQSFPLSPGFTPSHPAHWQRIYCICNGHNGDSVHI